MHYLIAVDIGTTSAKALAVTPNGSVLASHQVFYPTHYSTNGFAEQNPIEIFEAVVTLLKKIEQANKSSSLQAISFSAAMHSLMSVDEMDQPITPLLIWADTRSVEQAKKIEASRADVYLAKITGTPIHPMSPLCKLMWWQDHHPDIIAKAKKFISIKEYVVHQLTNHYLIDYSTASATGLFDIEKLQWSQDAAQWHRIPFRKFSQPVSIYYSIEITEEVSRKLALPANTKLVVGASDGCSAQLGSGAIKPGDVSITVGTSAAVRMVSSSGLHDAEGRLFNYLLDEKMFVSGGASNNGTALINWFQKLHPQSAEDISEFVKEIRNISAGSDGLLMLPFLLGERAPVYDAEARAAYLGISVNHTRFHFQRALLEGVCFQLKSIVSVVEENAGRGNRILVSGGITRSPEWVQLMSNVLQRQLQVSDQPDASAMGAAMIGFKSLGGSLEFNETQPKLFLPDVSVKSVYERQFLVYENLYSKLKDVFHELNRMKL